MRGAACKNLNPSQGSPYVLSAILLALMALLSGGAVRHKSLAIDEFARAEAGYQTRYRPPVGGGPPERKDWRFFGGNLMPFDLRETFSACLRDPTQLEPSPAHHGDRPTNARPEKKTVVREYASTQTLVNIFG
jgi:hypothetical protein